MLFSIYSDLKMGKIQGFLCEPLKHVITLRALFLVSRTGDDPPVCGFKYASVCTFETSPCMSATRAHVEKHVRVLLACTETF